MKHNKKGTTVTVAVKGTRPSDLNETSREMFARLAGFNMLAPRVEFGHGKQQPKPARAH